MIVGNVIGGNPVTPRTYIIETDDGANLVGVLVESDTEITADANDIREGDTAIGEAGVIVGKKVIPSYHTHEGVQIIPNGSEFKISLFKDTEYYDFTKLQAIICDFNTSLSNSVCTEKVALDRKVYPVSSVNALSEIMVNDTEETIDFGITNETGKLKVLRFMTYKEIE